MPPAPTLTRRTAATWLGALPAVAAWPVHAATPRDTLVLAAAFDDILTLDPAEAFEISTGEVLGNAYDRLVRFDVADPSKLAGDVAANWTVSADGTTFSFALKPNLKFASGSPLTAQDVAWSLQRAVRLDKTPAFILAQFGFTKDNVGERIAASGPLALKLVIDKPYAPSFVLNCLTANVAAVVDRTLALANEAGGDLGHAWLRTRYAGSGAFRIREWRANELLVLERNDRYHGGPAKLARVIYRHLKESATQRLTLERGDVDVARNLSPQDLAAIASNPGLKTIAVPKGTVYYVSLNQKHPALAKPLVREAFKWLVDYAAIGDTLMRDIGVVHQNFLPLGLLGAVKDNPYRLDVDKARALLAKAGLPNGFKVTMDVRTVQPVQGIAEAVQQTARRAGIEIEIIPGDGKQTLTRYRARTHDLYIGNWGADYWDPHTNADTFARNPDNADDAKSKTLAWRNAWAIPELTRQADAAVLERDAAKRAAAYAAIQAEFRRSSPFVMLFQQTEVAALRAGVDGFRLGPTSDSTLFHSVSKR
jgi:peptide/nickel transport system substrate-binding protein